MRFASPGWLALIAVVPALLFFLLRRGPAMPKARRLSFVVFRGAALVLGCLALAEPELALRSDRIDLVLLLDSSDSVDENTRASALEAFASIRARLGPHDVSSIVRFGADTEMTQGQAGAATGSAQERRAAAEAAASPASVDGSATDIGQAIQFAIAQTPGGPDTRRFLLASDGVENRGSALSASSLARALGVQVSVLPLLPSPQGEVLVQDVLVAEPMRAGEPREVTVILRSRRQSPARLAFLRDGTPWGTRDLLLEPGENAVRLQLTFPDPGLHSVEAIVQAPDDRLAENNRYSRMVEVSGTPAVLYVSQPGHRSASLLAALAAQGISSVTRDPGALPGTLAGFLPYDAVILDDVSAFSMSYGKMEMLEQYVRDAGGGLLMIGGEHSFGAGGWYQTPVERALPVDMDVTSVAQTPRLALVIVTDKSGSMSGTVSTGETKLDLVKSAALSALDLLNPFDRVGLLAFDADKEWTVPITDASNRASVARQLASLQPGGGTIMWPALDEARRALERTDAAVKHVIVLTDGLTNPGEFEPLVKEMRGEKITVSAVAVGADADQDLLTKIATWGGGRFYATDDARSIPRIFVAETLLASRGLLVEERFIPRASAIHELLRGISEGDLPVLGGHVLTYLKPGAERVLEASRESPLLATWRYGLGRSAAFTSDLAGRWSRQWLAWEGFPRFAAQLVRWIEAPRPSMLLHPQVTLAGGQGLIAVDAYDAIGRFADGLSMNAAVLGPDRERLVVALPQAGPGRYEGEFEAKNAGDFVISVSASAPAGGQSPAAVQGAGEAGGAEGPLVRTIGASLPYPEEYRDLGVNRRLLQRIAAETGGTTVDPADSTTFERLLRRSPASTEAGTPLWPVALALALAAFFLDIVARRFSLPEELREKLAALVARVSGSGRALQAWSYEELAEMVNRAHEEERRKLRERIAGLAAEKRATSDISAYLYLARLRSRHESAERSEPGKSPTTRKPTAAGKPTAAESSAASGNDKQ